jgi:hypothetical protein
MLARVGREETLGEDFFQLLLPLEWFRVYLLLLLHLRLPLLELHYRRCRQACKHHQYNLVFLALAMRLAKLLMMEQDCFLVHLILLLCLRLCF